MLRTIERTSTLRPERPPAAGTTLDAQVGDTPLLQLTRLATAAGLPPAVQLVAKAEWFNPSGSVKDRPARHIIQAAERQGRLRPGMILLDSTSGNMGIAYATLAASRGYRVRLTLPENASPERITVLRALGAELIFTDPLEGSDGAMVEAQRLAAAAAPDTFYADQYANPANWQAHYHTTAEEIWAQTGGRITHFVAGLGTGGTFTGTTRRLKELNPFVRAVAVEPDSPFHGLEGLKHMATALRPAIYDPHLPDANVAVRTEDAQQMALRLARTEGLFVGVSAAAAVVTALRVGRELEEGLVVTVLPDGGLKYLSERFWREE